MLNKSMLNKDRAANSLRSSNRRRWRILCSTRLEQTLGCGLQGYEDTRGSRLYENQVCRSRSSRQAILPAVGHYGCRPCGPRRNQSIDEIIMPDELANRLKQ